MSPNAGGGGGVAGSQPMSTAVHRSPNKLWRSNSIFNLFAACTGNRTSFLPTRPTKEIKQNSVWDGCKSLITPPPPPSYHRQSLYLTHRREKLRGKRRIAFRAVLDWEGGGGGGMLLLPVNQNIPFYQLFHGKLLM
jgi:hypothetical protein